VNLWRHLVGGRPIVTRLVLAVAGTMAAVLLVAGAFVFWRVQYALDRQLSDDLRVYQDIVERDVSAGESPPVETPGQTYQVYDREGHVIGGNTTTRLVDRASVAQAAAGGEIREDVGRLIPPADRPYEVVTSLVETPDGSVVVSSAISKQKHDEALRELLLQLAIADLATLAAASVVGYGTARAALNPVERYRLAAEQGDGASLLPVTAGKDDEVTRLGHTFNALLERIRQANERERQFLADASHELRSPLALMRAELEWALLRPPDEAETKTAFVSLRGQVERLIGVSNALLDLEELHASKETPREPVRVDALMDDVVAGFRDQVATEGRRIETCVSAGLTLQGNRHWLELALGNLVSNALHHGEGTIRLTAAETHGRTLLAVDDEGPGFSPDFIDKAFDRFTRADTSRTTQGTGLGLALVQAIAEAHAGIATVHCAKITLDLPTQPPSPAEPQTSRERTSVARKSRS